MTDEKSYITELKRYAHELGRAFPKITVNSAVDQLSAQFDVPPEDARTHLGYTLIATGSAWLTPVIR